MVTLEKIAETDNSNTQLGLGAISTLGGVGAMYAKNKVDNAINKVEKAKERMHDRAVDAGIDAKVNKESIDRYNKKINQLDQHIGKLDAAQKYRQQAKKLKEEFKSAVKNSEHDKANDIIDRMNKLKDNIKNDKSLKGKKFITGGNGINSYVGKGGKGSMEWLKGIQEMYRKPYEDAYKNNIYIEEKAKKYSNKYSQIAQKLKNRSKLLSHTSKAALGLGLGGLALGTYNKLTQS